MDSAQDSDADWTRMRERVSIVVAAGTLGGVVLIVGILIGAFVVVDQRAGQAFKLEPRIAHAGKRPSSSPASTMASAATVGSGASPPIGSPAPPQAIAGEAGPAPAAQESPTDSARHGRNKHGRRFAQGHSRGHIFGFFAGRW